MKKISIFLAFILGFAVLVLPVVPALAAELDQSFQGGPATDMNIHTRDFVGQTFIPTMPTLNWISAYLVSFETPRVVHAELIRASSGATIATGNQTISSSWGWRSIIGTATLVPGETYMLKLTASDGDIYWRSGTNGYASGIAYTPGADSGRDMWFQTYGTPGSSTAPSSSASPTASLSPGSGRAGSAPSQNIDTSIKVPTNLKAEDVSDKVKNEPKVKLTWEASITTDIDNYRIYGKKEGDTDFSLVAETDKDIIEYTDTKVEFDKKYTYMVRAYRNGKESESSNEVTITPKSRTLKNYGFLSFTGPIWQQWYFWALIALGLALIGVIIWFFADRAKKTKLAKDNINKY
jgi:hypothetical protein